MLRGPHQRRHVGRVQNPVEQEIVALDVRAVEQRHHVSGQQHDAQEVHAAEKHQDYRGDDGRPGATEAACEQQHEERDARPRPERHGPVQRRRAEPATGQPGGHVEAEVVAQQGVRAGARFGRQEGRERVRQMDGPGIPRQIGQGRPVFYPVGIVDVENAAGRGRQDPAQGHEQQHERRRPRRDPPGAAQRPPQPGHQQRRCRDAQPPAEPSHQPDGHGQHQVHDGEPVQDREFRRRALSAHEKISRKRGRKDTAR